MRFIFNRFLLEAYSEKLKKEFYDIFADGDEKTGKELLDTFDKSKQLLLNNDISNNIQKWISDAKKDPEKVEELKNILYNLKTRQNRIDKDFDIRKKRVPGEYKELWHGDGKTLYRIDDVVASMALGVNTGWCTTGRYTHYGEPNFVPSRKNAEGHFNSHTNLGGRGVGKLYYLVDDKTGYGLEAYHFQADNDGNYTGFSEFNAQDHIVRGTNETLRNPPKEGIEKIMYDDFMGCVDTFISNRPEFVVEDGCLRKYWGKKEVVVIPDNVEIISAWTFSKKENIKKVVIPSSVKKIGENAFSDCTKLESVEIGNGLNHIYNYAFYHCFSLKDITIPNSVAVIGDSVFRGCYSLTAVEIPDSVTHIGDYAFEGCKSLKSAKIGNGIEIIRSSTFEGCSNLASVVIPQSVLTIGFASFAECRNLTYLDLGNVESIGEKAFAKCLNLKSVTIPNSVTEIGKWAFYDCNKMETLTLSNNIDSISKSAFGHCSRLNSVTIPNNVVKIEGMAFGRCGRLETVRMGTGVRYIAPGSFACTRVKDVYYGGTKEDWSRIEIETNGLLDADIHFNSNIRESYERKNNTMKFIFEQSLLEEYSNKLKQEFYDVFTNGDEKTGKELLDTFDKSKQLLLNNGISNDIQKWISDARKDPSKVEELKNILHNLGTRQNRIDKNMDIRKRKVPGKYKEIGHSNGETLYRIDDVVASMALGVNTGWCTAGRYGHYGEPNFVPSRKNAEDHFKLHQDLHGRGIGKLYYTVDDETGYGLTAYHFQADNNGKYLGYTRFDDADRVVERNFDNPPKFDMSAEGIAYNDFMEYVKDFIENKPEFEIENGAIIRYNGDGGDVVIPNSVTSIGELAFYACASITSISVPNSVTSIGIEAFCGCTSLTSVVIPDSVKTIGGGAFYRCASLTSITLPYGITYIGGNMFSCCRSLTSVTIPDSVTEIRDGAFAHCTSLTSVLIPEGVTHIGDYAFRGCTELTDITIPSSVTFIGSGAFYRCKNLKIITLHDGVMWIGGSAFGECESLTEITIPASVKSIGALAFSDCTSMTNVYIQGRVRIINRGLFSHCTHLTSVVIPDGVTAIGEEAFNGCYRLTSVTIPDSVKIICYYAFDGCKSLTSINIPNSVIKIDAGAFFRCGPLKDVYYGGTKEDWSNIAIGIYNAELEGSDIHFNSKKNESYKSINRHSNSPITRQSYLSYNGRKRG